MVRFSAKPKNEPHSPPSRERSEREMQKTLLGYAHPSIQYLDLYQHEKKIQIIYKLATMAWLWFSTIHHFFHFYE
ncbi:MAG: hypothetical protein U5L45_10745 [Saprospiraceae bacterium]|nr:hypothetical protein [Saprospiraceae bacterium]